MICRVHRSNLDDVSGIHSFELLCLECFFFTCCVIHCALFCLFVSVGKTYHCCFRLDHHLMILIVLMLPFPCACVSCSSSAST